MGSDSPQPDRQLDPDALQAAVRGLYLGLLGREPDGPGLQHWLSVADDSGLGSVAAGLAGSEEHRLRQDAQLKRRGASELVAAAVDAARSLLAAAPLTIVDVGAQDLEDEEHIYAPLSHHSVPHTVIGFEPLEHRRAERTTAASDEGDSLKLLASFIGDGGAHTFHINAPDATSSLLPFNTELTRQFVDLDGLRTVAMEPANTTTLDVALAAEAAPDLLKLDIQGFELPALRHAPVTLARTQVVHCEVSFIEIYRGQALFSDVETLLRAQNFMLVDLLAPCRYPLAGTKYATDRDWLGWADALFLRALDRHASWRDRLVQSVLVLLLYGKPSLAAWLARGLEGTPASDYAQALGVAEPKSRERRD
jgi:FkbM family methyltransferase